MNSPPYDAIVVGSGAAGSWSAKALTEGGLRTAVVEAGRRLDPVEDFPARKRGERLSVMARAQGAALGQPVQARCSSYTAANRHLFVNDRDNPYSYPPESPFLWIRGRQVGGRLHTWARFVLRMSSHELEHNPHCPWPLTYAQLARHYDRVESFLGIVAGADGIARIPDSVGVRTHALNHLETQFRSDIEARWPDRAVISARYVVHDSQRTPKALRAAERTGLLSLQSDAVVRRVRLDDSGRRAIGVDVVDRVSGQEREIRAGLVVLCASAFETVRILLNSRVPDRGGLLGRYISDHNVVLLSGPLSREQRIQLPAPPDDPYDHRETSFYVAPFRNSDGAMDFSGGYGVQGAIGHGSDLWWLLAFGDMVPRRDNRVSLDPDLQDAWGVPAARITCARSSSDDAMISDMKAQLVAMAEAGGLKRWGLDMRRFVLMFGERFVSYRHDPDEDRRSGALAFLPGAGIHEVGGARMGTAPDDSVTDPYGRLWEVENLFVADGAVFPAAGPQGPTLTIMALADRTCRHIVETGP